MRWGFVVAILLSTGCSFDWDSLDARLGGTAGSGTSDGGQGGSTGGTGGVGGTGAAAGMGGVGGVGGMGGMGGMGGDPCATGGGSAVGMWQMPTLIVELSDVADDDDPTLSPDGLEVIFNTSRNGDPDFWTSTRASVDDAWDPPAPVVGLNTTFIESNGNMSPDGLTFWMESDRDGEIDIYVSIRQGRGSPWSTPVLVPELNSGMATGDIGGVTCDGLLLIQGGGGNFYERTRLDDNDPWGPAVLLDPLNSIYGEQEAWLHPLGTAVYFSSQRNQAGTSLDFFMSQRASTAVPWETPVEVIELNSITGDQDASLTQDESYVIFSRTVGANNRDLFESRR